MLPRYSPSAFKFGDQSCWTCGELCAEGVVLQRILTGREGRCSAVPGAISFSAFITSVLAFESALD